MSYTYSTWQTAFAEMLAVSPTNSDFVAVLPTIIDYAEQRIYRDLDLIATVVRNQSSTLTPNSRSFTLPTPATGPFKVVNQINVFNNSVRQPLTPTTQDVLDMLWPAETATSSSAVPAYFAMVTDQTLLVGPAPGSALTVEVVGTIRPTPLSNTNTTTYLTTYLPDLFMTASLIMGAAWQKNFGAQGDQPAQAQSYETQYMKLLASADVENQRAKFTAASWSSRPIAPQAQPQRG